jgi:hypothetical protein
MRSVLVAGIAALSVGSISAMARDARILEPSSKWVLDYAPERCTLARSFGSDDESMTFQIISYGDWNNFHTMISGPLVPRPVRPGGKVRIAFSGDKQKRDPIFALEGSTGTSSAASFDLYFGPFKPLPKGLRLMDHEQQQRFLELARPEPEVDKQVDSLTLELDHGTPTELHVENMAAPLAALRKCVDDLYNSWGMDAEVQRNLSRLPRPLPQTLHNVENHYPASQQLAQNNGYVRVRLLIDADGQPKSCVMQVEPVDEAFKKAVCDNLSGRFEPALDKDGHPVESMYFTAVIYLIA